MNRFTDFLDKNKRPIYEGDTAMLDVVELSERGSNIGRFVKNFIDDGLVSHVKFIPTFPSAGLNVEIDFIKSDGTPLLNKDANDFEKTMLKEGEEAFILTPEDEPYVLRKLDNGFLRYLFNNRLTLVDCDDRAPIDDAGSLSVSGEDLFFTINGQQYCGKDRFLFPMTSKAREVFKEDIERITKGTSDYLTLSFERLQGLELAPVLYFSDIHGEPSSFRMSSSLTEEANNLIENLMAAHNLEMQESCQESGNYRYLLIEENPSVEEKDELNKAIEKSLLFRKERKKLFENKVQEIKGKSSSYKDEPYSAIFLGISAVIKANVIIEKIVKMIGTDFKRIQFKLDVKKALISAFLFLNY